MAIPTKNLLCHTFRIVTLVENCVYGHRYRAEHGLSVYIEMPNCRLLFDTGASGLFRHNARVAGIDLKEVDFLVLSHGHADHTGGLLHFLELNSKATVVCKPQILVRKFKNERENGMPPLPEAHRGRFRFVEGDALSLVPGVEVVSHIALHHPADTHFDKFFRLEKERLVPDTFEDELALVLEGGRTYSVLSACSHRGITNLLETVRQRRRNRSLDLLLGGFHIHKAPAAQCDFIADYLARFSPARLGVCHCTGVEAFATLRRRLGAGVFYNSVGTELVVSGE